VIALAVTPDNKFIVSGSADHSMKLFDLQTKEQVHHFQDAHDSKFFERNQGLISCCLDWVVSLTITHDSRLIISGCYSSMKIHDLQTKQQVHFFEDVHSGNFLRFVLISHNVGAVNSVLVTSDNKLLISGCDDQSIKIHDLETKQQVHHFKDVHQGKINKISRSLRMFRWA